MFRYALTYSVFLKKMTGDFIKNKEIIKLIKIQH
jgi:hypothetical protein